MNKIGSGVSNKKSAQMERAERERILDNFVGRVKDTGRYPGTHTLGSEFVTSEPRSLR